MDRLQIIREKITELLARKQLVLLAIDGYGGAGKSTLAKEIQSAFPSSVIITLDDFSKPLGQGVDRIRFIAQVLEPLSKGLATSYQRFDWKKQALADWKEIKPEGLVILEGVSMLASDFNNYYDLRIWIDCPVEVATQRGKERDKRVHNVDNDKAWDEVWTKEDMEYAKKEPWKRADIIIDYCSA